MADYLCAFHLIHATPELMVVQADVKRLESAVDSASGDVDVFLTCEWPSGVTAAVPPALLPPDLPLSAGATGTGHLRALHLGPKVLGRTGARPFLWQQKVLSMAPCGMSKDAARVVWR